RRAGGGQRQLGGGRADLDRLRRQVGEAQIGDAVWRAARIEPFLRRPGRGRGEAEGERQNRPHFLIRPWLTSPSSAAAMSLPQARYPLAVRCWPSIVGHSPGFENCVESM